MGQYESRIAASLKVGDRLEMDTSEGRVPFKVLSTFKFGTTYIKLNVECESNGIVSSVNVAPGQKFFVIIAE